MQYCRNWLVLGALLSLISACEASPSPPGLTYQVAIDPAFTTDQIDAITAGLQNWIASVPQLRVTYAIADCNAPGAEQVCMHPDFSPPNVTDDVVGDTQPARDDNATIVLYVDRIKAAAELDPSQLTQQTAAHEMGHALGLKHSATGTLMAADVQNQAATITSADVDQFWSVRGK